jgi:hypothetical protein
MNKINLTKMKKIASLLLMFIAVVSCTTDVTRNSPALEGLKDDVRWRSKSNFAELAADNSVTLNGLTPYESLTMKASSIHPGTYILGNDTFNYASYLYSQNGDELFYTTGANIGGDGEIVIKEYDNVNMTISGTFRFNAINVNDNPMGGPILNYHSGVFYKVQVVPAL